MTSPFYVSRADNTHAKAGNLNHALSLTDGELIAVFDADHVPVRGFLHKTVGFFDDPRIALVQTAQHFFNPDPYERNLRLEGRIAPEQHFFYHVIQPGNDFWNSAFFCGTCAVLRRSAIEQIGGIKTETVTEDAHTALELHARGYRSVYLAQPLSAGLATETFAAHIKQRMRWARGMAQILRIDCPLFKRGLSIAQRLNYFNAMFHFFFGIPRLILILAPLFYLLLGVHPIKADALAVIAYILPHVSLAMIANSMISRWHRHSFWAGVYEVSIAPYTAFVTLLSMFNPRLGTFNVTDKGANLDQIRFDLKTSWITIVLLVLSLLGLVVAFPLRLFYFHVHGGEPSELHSIFLNSIWAVGNLIVLIAATCVALEQPQQRRFPRVKRDFSAEIRFGEARIPCRTEDISEGGVRLLLAHPQALPRRCQLSLFGDFGVGVSVMAKPVRCDWDSTGKVEVALAFEDIDDVTHRKLVELIFSGDEGWRKRHYPVDRPLDSFWYLLTTFWRATRPRETNHRHAPPVQGRWRASYLGIKCECLVLSGVEAILRFPGLLSDREVEGELQVEIGSGKWLRVRRAKASKNKGNRLFVHFQWSDFSEEKAFWQSLYQDENGGSRRFVRKVLKKGIQVTASRS